MNRENLFRGKRLDNEEWIQGSLITGVFTRLGQDIPYILCPERADYDCFEDFSEENGIFEVYPETVCQYTRRLDDNKKKIYEEYFVKINNDWVGRVVWSDDTTSFCVLPNDDIEHETYCLGYYIEEGYKVEVIGNIFDNPELLDKAGKPNGES